MLAVRSFNIPYSAFYRDPAKRFRVRARPSTMLCVDSPEDSEAASHWRVMSCQLTLFGSLASSEYQRNIVYDNTEAEQHKRQRGWPVKYYQMELS